MTAHDHRPEDSRSERVHPNLCSRRWLVVFLGLSTCAAAEAQSGLSTRGFIATRLSATDAEPSWINGGFGRLPSGDGSGQDLGAGVEARLQFDYSRDEHWAARLHLGARADHGAQGRNLGLVEAYVDRRWSGENQRLQLRLGHFFLHTSLENIEALWVSPYALTHSALNSWIGEEFRPLGADLRWRRQFDSGSLLEMGFTPFVGNDASGALLAWRGFAWHDRVSYFGETLPLPPLGSLGDPSRFGDQNDAGSKPFGPDLDGRPGYALRARFGDLLNSWQISLVDTQGDARLYRGEYAWRTRFLLAGWEHNPLGEGWGLAAEVLDGTSRMGRRDGPNANVRMRTAYLLTSYGRDPWRYSLRVEAFDIEDLDRSSAEINDESGEALTLAAIRQVGDWRLGLEFLHVDGKRPAALDEDFPLQAGGRQLRIEARYVF